MRIAACSPLLRPTRARRRLLVLSCLVLSCLGLAFVRLVVRLVSHRLAWPLPLPPAAPTYLPLQASLAVASRRVASWPPMRCTTVHRTAPYRTAAATAQLKGPQCRLAPCGPTPPPLPHQPPRLPRSSVRRAATWLAVDVRRAPPRPRAGLCLAAATRVSLRARVAFWRSMGSVGRPVLGGWEEVQGVGIGAVCVGDGALGEVGESADGNAVGTASVCRCAPRQRW